MPAQKKNNFFFLLGALAVAGCAQPVLGIQVDVVTSACPGVTDTSPITGVNKLRFGLTGDGLDAQTLTVDLNGGSARLPNIPIGGNRRLTVEALAGGQVRSRADSGKFDALGPDDVHLRLFLRNVDAFTGTSDESAACTHMMTPRAGHAMSLLPDGRVLISGGYSFDSSSPPKLVYHDDAEIFDPGSGTFSTFVPGPALRRAGHAALAVNGESGDGVLLAGGEGTGDTISGKVSAIRPYELFAKGAWTELNPSGPSRSHAASAVDLKTGAALIAGGQAGPDAAGVTVYDSVTWFDPATNQLQDAAMPLRVGQLTDAVAVARANLSGGHTTMGGIVLVGGRDETGAVLDQISGLIWGPGPTGSLDFVDDATFKNAVFKLPAPRAHHVALRTVDDLVLTAGGVTSMVVGAFDYSNATDAITVIDPIGAKVSDLPVPLSQARADSCAILLDDGTALIAGGAWKDSTSHSARNVDLIAPDRSVRTAAGPPNGTHDGLLQSARHKAACLKLRDGSVLISGGLQFPAAGGTPVVLSTAEIFVPTR